MSAYWKIPLQALVLLVGVFMFMFYVFTPPPMLFNPVHRSRQCQGTAEAAYFASLDTEFGRRSSSGARPPRRRSGDGGGDAAAFRPPRPVPRGGRPRAPVRRDAVDLVKRVSGDASYTDVNYVFPTFVTTTCRWDWSG